MLHDDNPLEIPKLADHESGLRRLMADASAEPYVAFTTLAEAQTDPNAVAVFEGDYGGQIYLVARVTVVRCSEATLAQLLADIDATQWRDPDGARVYYERQPPGTGIAGGMGGAIAPEAIWVHERLRHLENAISDVLADRRARID